MAMVLGRAFSVGIAGMILAALIAAIGNKLAPNEHLLLLEGHDAFHLVVYCSVFLGGCFGAVVGAISAAADLIVAATRREQSGGSRPVPTPKPG